MNIRLFFSAVLKFSIGLLFIGLLIFLPAGTLDYPNAWIFMAALFIPMFIAGIVMMIKNPELLKKKLNAKEKVGTQKAVILFSSLMFISGFVLAGLDFRFKWTNVPKSAVIISTVLFLLSYIMYAEVLRENAYLSRTIEVQENQKVIDTGLYANVRHPMYTATLILFLTMPLILDSFISFIVFLIYPVLTIIRIKNEEELLTKELKGYDEYQKKVRYRLIPYIW